MQGGVLKVSPNHVIAEVFDQEKAQIKVPGILGRTALLIMHRTAGSESAA
jgi:hypothetical protein